MAGAALREATGGVFAATGGGGGGSGSVASSPMSWVKRLDERVVPRAASMRARFFAILRTVFHVEKRSSFSTLPTGWEVMAVS